MPSGLNRKTLSGVLQRSLKLQTLAPNIVTDYSDEIEGPEDSFTIPVAQSVTVSDYTAGGKVTVQEDPTTLDPTLEMEHQKAFSFVMSGNSNLGAYIQQYADQGFQDLLTEADQYVFAQADPAKTGNMTAGDISFTLGTDSPAELVKQVSTNLSNSGVPRAGRYAVVDPGTANEIYDIAEDKGFERADLVNEVGFVATLRGIRIFEAEESQFFSNAGTRYCFYGNSRYMGYGNAVVNVKVIEDMIEYPNGVGVNGLHVAGAKVIQPNAFGRIAVN